jgi:hypothetical protein
VLCLRLAGTVGLLAMWLIEEVVVVAYWCLLVPGTGSGCCFDDG